MTEATQNQDITNPDTFHAMLADIAQGSEPEGAQEEAKESLEQEEVAAPEEIEEKKSEEEEKKQEQEQSQEEDEDDSDAYEVHKNDKGAFVPLGKFKKTIQTTKALKEELNTQRNEYLILKQQYDAMQATIKEFLPGNNEQNTQQDNSEYEPLDSDADRIYKKKMAELESKQNQIEETIKNQSAIQTVVQLEAQFAATVPDYSDALKFVAQKLEEESSIFLGKSKDQVNGAAVAAINHIVQTAYSQGRNPSEVLYNLAKTKGYAGKKTDNTPKQPKPDLDAINKNMKKSTSVNNIPETPASSGIYTSAEAFKKMLDEKGNVKKDEFHKELERIKRINEN